VWHYNLAATISLPPADGLLARAAAVVAAAPGVVHHCVQLWAAALPHPARPGCIGRAPGRPHAPAQQPGRRQPAVGVPTAAPPAARGLPQPAAACHGGAAERVQAAGEQQGWEGGQGRTVLRSSELAGVCVWGGGGGGAALSTVCARHAGMLKAVAVVDKVEASPAAGSCMQCRLVCLHFQACPWLLPHTCWTQPNTLVSPVLPTWQPYGWTITGSGRACEPPF
jgi:hypothetical protein